MVQSLSQQSTKELGGRASVLAGQRRDHEELDRLMAQYWAVDESRRPRIFQDITQLVFSHAFAEETVLWPVVRRILPEGHELTADVETEHQQINSLVKQAEHHPDAPEYNRWVQEAFELIRQDIRDEEDRVLPRLQEELDPKRLVLLGAAWDFARRAAPTHPHPYVPRRPPGNVVCGVPLSAYDRTRDLFSPGGWSPVWAVLVTTAAAGATWGLTRKLRRPARS